MSIFLSGFEEPLASERSDYLCLALIPGIGARTMLGLLGHFRSPAAVLAASFDELCRVHRVGPKIAGAIVHARASGCLSRVVTHCQDNSIRILIPIDQDYPRLLQQIADPPLILYARGAVPPPDQLCLAIVGSRHATAYGRTVTEGLASQLARAGFTIVSGLARGIDAYAHRATLEAEGRTAAVLGSHVTDIYPAEHTELAQRITEKGWLLSETGPFENPKAGVFPARNRIISGLCAGVIVVEAAERSGALITATHAGEQGRDLFAIPGPVHARMSRGCNQLIRDGAILVQDASDVIDHLGPLMGESRLGATTSIRHPAELQLNEQERAVLQHVAPIPTDIDEIIVRSQLAVSRVLSTIGALEMRGLVQRTSGRCIQRTR
jgi:DNA processing protein